MKEWHLLLEKIPQRGSWNMAVDDYLFQSLGKEPTTYLRFYQWERPTISIGYSQNATRDSYRLISEALMRGLEKMGIKCSLAASTPSSYARGLLPCFSHPAQNEIEIDGKKIIGSAQKRTGDKFIQHGSIPLKKGEGLLKFISKLNREAFRMNMTSLSDILEREVDFDWVVEHLQSGISEHFNIRLNPKSFSSPEKEAIKKIQAERYDNPAWTHRIEPD